MITILFTFDTPYMLSLVSMPVLIWIPPKADLEPRIFEHNKGDSRKRSEGMGIKTVKGGSANQAYNSEQIANVGNKGSILLVPLWDLVQHTPQNCPSEG